MPAISRFIGFWPGDTLDEYRVGKGHGVGLLEAEDCVPLFWLLAFTAADQVTVATDPPQRRPVAMFTAPAARVFETLAFRRPLVARRFPHLLPLWDLWVDYVHTRGYEFLALETGEVWSEPRLMGGQAFGALEAWVGGPEQAPLPALVGIGDPVRLLRPDSEAAVFEDERLLAGSGLGALWGVPSDDDRIWVAARAARRRGHAGIDEQLQHLAGLGWVPKRRFGPDSLFDGPAAKAAAEADFYLPLVGELARPRAESPDSTPCVRLWRLPLSDLARPERAGPILRRLTAMTAGAVRTFAHGAAQVAGAERHPGPAAQGDARFWLPAGDPGWLRPFAAWLNTSGLPCRLVVLKADDDALWIGCIDPGKRRLLAYLLGAELDWSQLRLPELPPPAPVPVPEPAPEPEPEPEPEMTPIAASLAPAPAPELPVFMPPVVPEPEVMPAPPAPEPEPEPEPAPAREPVPAPASGPVFDPAPPSEPVPVALAFAEAPPAEPAAAQALEASAMAEFDPEPAPAEPAAAPAGYFTPPPRKRGVPAWLWAALVLLLVASAVAAFLLLR